MVGAAPAEHGLATTPGEMDIEQDDLGQPVR